MKQLLRILALSVSFLMASGGAGYSQNFQKGLEAADKGDFAAALREWQPLAEQGDASAQYNLGAMYYNGQGLPQNYQEAVKWFRKAAEQGFAEAQFSLGLRYFDGQGVTQNYKEAVKWFRKLAEQGHVKAQHNLGVMYSKGQGVIQDNVYAHMWFNIAASHGGTHAVKNRDNIAIRMTPSQIGDAQKLARECVKKNYIGC